MGDLVYRCVDLTTNIVLNDLPLSPSELPRQVSSDADTSSTLPMYDEGVRELNPKSCTIPGRTAVFALRDETPIWSGIIWSRSYSRKSRLLTLNMSTVESYWRHRVFNQRMELPDRDQIELLVWMMTGIFPLAGYTNVQERLLNFALGPNYNAFTSLDPENGFYIRDYDGRQIPVAQSIANFRLPYYFDADDNVFRTNVQMSGVKRDRTYDAAKNVYDAMVELSGVQGGPEWTVEPVKFSDSSLGWIPRFGYPRLGRTVDQTSWSWKASMPGEDTGSDNVRDYTYAEDVRGLGNHVVGTGAEVNGRVIVSDRGNLQTIRNGYPLLEVATSYSDVVSQATLDGHVAGDLNERAIGVGVTTWTVDPDMEPEFGSYSLGDEAGFSASDDLDEEQGQSPGRVTVERILGWTFVPQTSSEREAVKLNTIPTAQSSLRMPASLKKRYDNWDRQIKGLAIVSRAPQSKVAVSSSDTSNKILPNSGTAGVRGPWVVIAGLFFTKQADIIHHMLLRVSGNAAITWNLYDAISGEQIQFLNQSIYRGTGGNGSILETRWSLNRWEYGETVDIEVRAQQSDINGTTETSTVKHYAAYQGPS